MVGGGLFVPFTVVLSVVPNSTGELKNIGRINGIYTSYEKLLSGILTLQHLKASVYTKKIQKTSEIFHAVPQECCIAILCHAIEITAIRTKKSRCILGGITTNIPIMHYAYVVLTVSPNVFSEAWYKIVMQHFLVLYKARVFS